MIDATVLVLCVPRSMVDRTPGWDRAETTARVDRDARRWSDPWNRNGDAMGRDRALATEKAWHAKDGDDSYSMKGSDLRCRITPSHFWRALASVHPLPMTGRGLLSPPQ